METAEILNASSISASINSIPMLNGANFKAWRNKVTMLLGCMDLDSALRIECPLLPTDQSTEKDQKAYERWDRSNRVSLMILRNAVPGAFLENLYEEHTAKTFLETLEERFAQSDKAETSAAMRKLVTMKYKGNGNVREHIMDMINLAGKLKTLKIEVPDEFLVHLVLISLPWQFSQFEVSYNCQKEKWTMNEIISHLVQEEERLKLNKIESAHLASTSNGLRKRKGKESMVPHQKKNKGPEKGKKVMKCYFCKDTSHVKKDCPKYATWRVKKGLPELPKA